MASSEKENADQAEKNIPEIISLVNSNDLSSVQNILLNRKIKVDETDESGITPLQHAAYKGQYDMCKLLLNYGADINADYHDHHYSALHFAALSGNVQIVKMLLASGAKTYHTNTLKRTAAQMAGFVGNHVIVALINNYLPISDIQYYTKPQGLETEPKLPPDTAKPLSNLIMQTNLRPVYIAMTVEKSPVLMKHVSNASKVLNLMCEKEVKRSENVNEVICVKFHFLSYVLKTLEKELNKPKGDEIEKKDDRLAFEAIIKKWLIGRASDGFEEHLEFYVRDAIKSFPYVEMPLFLQIVRNISSKPGESWTLDILHGVINGQKGFDDGISCSTCGLESETLKKCSKCKSVQYCDRTCQRLHWGNHKKFCEKYMKEYNKRQEVEKEKRESEKEDGGEKNSITNEQSLKKTEDEEVTESAEGEIIINDNSTIKSKA